MREHRIEFIIKTPKGTLETITVTVAAKAKAAHLATLARQIRALLAITIFPEEPLTLEHVRDYPVAPEREGA